MKLLKLIPAAAIALTALIPLKANAMMPNGWSQVGQDCTINMKIWEEKYIKLQKKSDNSVYGVYKVLLFEGGIEEWVDKDVTLEQANRSMNNKCGGNSYQPT